MSNPYANYDAMGNMTCRNIDTTTAHTCAGGSPNGASMTYDAEGRMDSWTAPSGTTASDKFLYDNEGNRVLQRTSTTTGSTTTVTDDITFDSYTEVTISGGTTATAKYYNVAGQRVAMRVNGTLSYLLSDILGSSTIALNSDGSGQAVQLFSPYGSVRYNWGSMPTTYNFTGQRLDSQTGLLYYNSRYYDSVSGRFTSVDTVQNNEGGMDPFAYVGDNPETKNDPTGQRIVGANGESANIETAGNSQWRLTTYISTSSYWRTSSYTYVAGPNYHRTSSISYHTHYYPVHRSAPVVHHSSDSLWGRLGHGLQQLGGLLSGMWHNFTAPAPPGAVDNLMPNMCGTLSFAPKTKVATSRGEKAIGSLHQGDHVWAYNPKTHRMELEPVVHVWINRDYDLVDVTISSTTSAQHGKSAQKTSEVVHTNQKHPFLTVEKGFVPVSQLHVGMHVVKADGGAGTITMLKAVAGAMTMYNLEVAQDHTFTVGKGEWIVHNCGVGPVGSNEDPPDNITMQDILNNPDLLKHLSAQQVEQIVARDGGWVTGPLRKSGLQGETFNQLNSRGTAFTDKYIQWHAGGGRHGPNPIWKVSTNKGIVHVDYEGGETTGGETTGGETTGGETTGGETTGGETTGGDIPDLIDP